MQSATRPADPDNRLTDSVRRDQGAFLSSMSEETGAFLAAQEEILAEISPESLSLLSAIRGLTSGGKRIRALLCFWGWRAAGGTGDLQPVARAGAALEFFQAAALMHDDVIDRSETRRGAPSIHRQFRQQHLDAGWHLDADRFGTSSAILAGDLCLAFSEELFTGACVGAGASSARAIFNRMRTEVMAGQYLDLLEEAVGPDLPPATAADRALNILRYKSAKYSIERPVMLGGALAGADAATLARFSAFALPLGEAFQLRDDVLGVFGDPAVTGKPAGDDLREGKRTYLIARALAGSGPHDQGVLNSLLGDPALDDEGVSRLRGLITASGALRDTEKLIQDRSAEAFAALGVLETDEVSAAALGLLAEAAVTRTF
ncbi:polyprenyl synthetase family protein [Arthrobacter sp. MSA 4-2]|uniref:polyprenyl synthetase family protein n=1 Tax=Arthrobacter sp. MSA 4-2 TaxID=2794349 RepID=UPI0018E79ED9|nr:polyprenyl synthetase family protein [Arthrobacter sp. MSA 4-2]MBJ2122125.1 polyprenyl synthetase family protein [Arthrobacter sp. MSA 4-2]